MAIVFDESHHKMLAIVQSENTSFQQHEMQEILSSTLKIISFIQLLDLVQDQFKFKHSNITNRLY